MILIPISTNKSTYHIFNELEFEFCSRVRVKSYAKLSKATFAESGATPSSWPLGAAAVGTQQATINCVRRYVFACALMWLITTCIAT